MPRIQPPTIHSAPDETRSTLTTILEEQGYVPHIYRLMAMSPALMAGWTGLQGALQTTFDAQMRNAIALAEGERGGEIRYLGEFDASPESMRRFVKRLAAKHERLHFCYEAGPTGYGLHRLITELGHSCIVVAPSLVPRRPGDRGQDKPA